METLTHRTPKRPFVAQLLIAVVFVCTLFTLSAAAQLARVGPVDPANGFPRWYQDKTGLALDHCLPQNQEEQVWCLLPPIPNGTAPEVFPGNWAIENFFADVTSGIRKAPIPGTNQTTVVMLTMALESSFSNGFNVAPGDQVVFARTRIKISPVPFSGAYTVYTPVGKFEFADQVAGDRIFFTEDVGLTPLDFAQALSGRIGPFMLPAAVPGGAELPPVPLLQPGQDPYYDALLAAGGATPDPATGRKYLADPGRIGPITGGKTGITGQAMYVVGDGTTRDPNIFRVEGPNGFLFESTDFSIMGRVYEGPIAGETKIDRASYARSAKANKVDVYATATSSTQGRIPASALPATVPTQLSYYDAPCTPTLDANGNPGPPYSAPAVGVANQMFNSGSNYFGQSAPATIPLEVCVQGNSVNALGQTVTNYLPAPLGDQVFITEALYDAASQTLSVKASSSDQVVAQTLTVEGFGSIDPIAGQLLVNPLLAPPATIRVLSSGRGENQFQVSTGGAGGASGSSGGGATAAPVALNDSVSTPEDTAVIIDVLANDSNAIGGTVNVASAPLLGTVVINADGTLGYTPNLNVNGTDTFTYTVTVGTQLSNAASVTITIVPVNDPPVAVNDTTGALRGVSNSVNVFANDSDPDGAADLASAVIVTGNPSLGIAAGAVFNGGTVTFTPPATTAAGTYTFTYNAVDKSGAASANPATVTVNLSASEAIVPAKANYVQSKGRWIVSGTVSPIAGQTITIAYDPGTVATYKVNGVCSGNAAGLIVGKATVDALGNWLFDQILTSTAGVLNPSNTLGNSTGFWCTPPTKVRITSSLSGTSVPFNIQLK